MSENYFDSWSSSPVRHYSQGPSNQFSLQTGLVQSHPGPQLSPNSPNHYSSMYGSSSPANISTMPNENFRQTHSSQMHLSQGGSSAPLRRVVNIGIPASVVGYTTHQYHPIESQMHSCVSNLNQEFFQNGTNDQPNRQFLEATQKSQAQEMQQRADSEPQELSFRSLLSQQITQQGFSIRSFLDERNSAELRRSHITQGANSSVPHINSQICADETEEALFAVTKVL
jgi:hypothetical protein